MTKGLAILVGSPPKAKDSDIENQERENALRAFMSATQNGDVQQGLKAWARMSACGPPPMPSDDGEGESDNPPMDEKPSKGKTSMYREED
jgi:hypothetical protein